MGVSKSYLADKEFIAAVRALVKLGYTQEYIAEVLHKCPTTIGNICVQYGFKREGKAEDPERKRREEIRRRLKEFYEKGCTDKELASKTQISVEKVKCWRIRNNLAENTKDRICEATGCKYHAQKYANPAAWEHGCDYACITGRTRTGQLTKKELRTFPCKLYVPGKRERQKPEPIVLQGSTPKRERRSCINWEYGEKLWEEGKSDREIAEVLGCSHSIVQAHRKEWGEANTIRYVPQDIYDWTRGKELWKEGKTTRQISEELGCSLSSARRKAHQWRIENSE